MLCWCRTRDGDMVKDHGPSSAIIVTRAAAASVDLLPPALTGWLTLPRGAPSRLVDSLK
jgi:hypothetical protein